MISNANLTPSVPFRTTDKKQLDSFITELLSGNIMCINGSRQLNGKPSIDFNTNSSV